MESVKRCVCCLVGVLFTCGLALTLVLAEEGNLFQNSSFEDVDSEGRPAGWNTSFGGEEPGTEKTIKVSFASVAGGKSGEMEAQLKAPEGVDWVYAEQLVELPLAVGEEYVLSVWMKSDVPARVEVCIGCVPREDRTKWQWVRNSKDVTNSWEKYEASVKISDATEYMKLRCVFQLYTQGATLSLDDASIVKKG